MAVADTVRVPDRAEKPAVPSTGWLAALGTAAGLGALVSSSCCVLPLALAGLGASTAVFSGLEVLTNWRPFLLGGAGLVLFTAWALLFRQRSAVCRTGSTCAATIPSRNTAVLLGLGSAFLALAFVWEPFVEPILLKLVR
jgi:mercuric ion transport protein